MPDTLSHAHGYTISGTVTKQTHTCYCFGVVSWKGSKHAYSIGGTDPDHDHAPVYLRSLVNWNIFDIRGYPSDGSNITAASEYMGYGETPVGPKEQACQYANNTGNPGMDLWKGSPWISDRMLSPWTGEWAWWAVDMLGEFKVVGLRVEHREEDSPDNKAQEIYLYSSVNGSYWVERAHFYLNGDTYQELFPAAITARYWKFQATNTQGSDPTMHNWIVDTFKLLGDESYAKSSKHGYARSRSITSDSRHVFAFAGVGAKGSWSGYIFGAVRCTGRNYAWTRGVRHSLGSKHAYLEARILVRASHSDYLRGSSFVRRSVHAFVGGTVRSTVHSFTEGLMTEYNHIWLNNSTTTLHKKFRVVAQGYDDGTPEKAESLERTIGGGLNLSVGAIYTTWSPIIRVRHTETETDYGTLDELMTFYSYINPNGTPTNKLTFTDHHGVDHSVYIVGSFKKAIMGFHIEGDQAWYTVALRFIEVP